MTHELKTWPEYFESIRLGYKTFEVRKNDRDFKEGDKLILKEWKPAGYSSTCPNELTGEYTGNEIECFVPYILKPKPEHISFLGINSDYVVMTIFILSINGKRPTKQTI